MTTQEKFNNWLDDIIKNEKPNSDIIAYWVGIFETEEGYETYLIGSREFDSNDDDWAYNVDFTPENNYLAIGQVETDWETILNQVKNFLTDYIQSNNFKDSFLNKSIAIAYGFDGGELHRIK